MLREPRRIALLASVSLLLAVWAFADLPAQEARAPRETATRATTQAGRARAILREAVQALGGAERLAQWSHWYVEGRGRENLTGQLQGLRPDRLTWRPHEERVAVDSQSLSIAWERRSPRNDHSLRWRRMIYKPDSLGIVDWNGNRGVLRPAQNPEPQRRALARRLPHLLLLEAAARAQRVAWSGERSVAGRPHDVLEVELPEAVELTLLLARKPAVLRGVEYRTHMPGRGDVTVAWEWPEWRPDAQLGFVPAGHRVRIAGEEFQQVDYAEYSASSPRAQELLEVPERLLHPAEESAADESAGPPPAEPPFPLTGMVAPGVMVANVRGFVVMFVEFSDFVVAFDAPERDPGFEAIPSAGSRGEITGEYHELIRKTFPGKPVRYAALSHHHGDHMGGMRAFAAAGATLLVAPGEQAALRRLLDAPHTIAHDPWNAGAGAAKIETVARRRTLTDGQRRLEIINLGENPHTAENLFLWLPAERILMQGDLFYYIAGGEFPPSGRERMNRFFARWLREHKLDPLAIYGTHNYGPAGPEAVARAAQLPAPAPAASPVSPR